MAVERDPALPAWLTIERQYDGDDEATAAALVEMVRYSQSRDLAHTVDRDALAAVIAEAGLSQAEHQAVCRDFDCGLCDHQGAERGATP